MLVESSLALQRSVELERRLETAEATVAVIGAGYVGLPLALALAESGYRLWALDVDHAIAGKAEDVARTSRIRGEYPIRPRRIRLPHIDAFAAPEIYIQLLNAEGEVVDRSANLAEHQLPLTSGALAQGREREVAWICPDGDFAAPHNFIYTRQIKNMLGNAVRGARCPPAVSVAAQIEGVHVVILTQRTRDPIPTAGMVERAVNEHERWLGVLAIIPELEFQAVGVKEVRDGFQGHRL